jgi:hypothetical protein
LATIIAQSIVRHRIGLHAAAVIHEADESQIAFDHFIGHPPKVPERAVDECHPALLIKHDDSDVQVVDDRAHGGKFRRHVGNLSF